MEENVNATGNTSRPYLERRNFSLFLRCENELIYVKFLRSKHTLRGLNVLSQVISNMKFSMGALRKNNNATLQKEN